MALFYGQPCPLCGVKMTTEDRRFATSHFLGPESDLWRFSDAVMHWDCYAEWEHRPRFARMYFEARKEWNGPNPHWGVAYSDERVFVTVNPDKLVGEVDVSLAETGSGFRIPLDDWEDWLEGEWFGECNHEVEREALAGIIPLLRSKLPTAEAVVSSAGMGKDAGSKIAAAGGIVARISHEFACQKLAERAASKGVACPECGRFSSDYDFVRVEQVSESGPQSHLVCSSCGKEFGPEDV
jgi:ssDNA-binding Zn-finger/Zn-ribbon topoisomerase 1